ncbi:hypothetical protein GQ42DRAFT_30717 [Ramicandelaber brevisporus]|nr:hypothetical protein GQ42DRAFT_30717 [Ramicandelaber brevisporus]
MFFWMLGISQPDFDSTNNEDDELKTWRFNTNKRTFYAAFSTLYDPISRAAYDVLGDGMFAHFGIQSGACDTHPSYFYRCKSSLVWSCIALMLAVLATCGGFYLGEIYGDKTKWFCKVWSFVYPAFVTLSKYPENWLTLCELGTAVANGLGIQLGSLAVDNANLSKVRSFAMRHGFNMAPTINQRIMDYFPCFVLLAWGYPTAVFWSARPDDYMYYTFAIFMTYLLVEGLMSTVSIIRCKNMTIPQLLVLLSAVSVKLDDWYPDGENNVLIRSQVKELLEREHSDNRSSQFRQILDIINSIVAVAAIVIIDIYLQLSMLPLILSTVRFGLSFYSTIFIAVVVCGLIASTAKRWYTARSLSSNKKSSAVISDRKRLRLKNYWSGQVAATAINSRKKA